MMCFSNKALISVLVLAGSWARAEEEFDEDISSQVVVPPTLKRHLQTSTNASAIVPSTYSPPASLDQTSFVVLSAPRSASTSLKYALDAHPSIESDGELFSTHGVMHSYETWTIEMRDANRTEFMRDVFERTKTPPRKHNVTARGFKIFWNHLLESELLALTRPKHVLKIVLRRQDTFAEFVSQTRMLAVSNSERPKTAAEVEQSLQNRVTIDWDDYQKWLATEGAWYGWCARQAQEHPESWLFISSEQLVSNPYTMMAVYAHLRVPPGNAMEYDPYVDVPLEEKVANWDEIKDRVQAAPTDEPNAW